MTAQLQVNSHTAGRTLFDVTVTSFTARVVEQALARRFRVEGRRQGGRLVILLNQRGRENTFGALYVGMRTGRITGAVLHRGNSDPVGDRYTGAHAAAHAIMASAPSA